MAFAAEGRCLPLCFSILLSAILAPVAVAQSSLSTVRTGIPAYYEAFLPLYASVQKGYFAEEGIKVEITTFKGGGAAGQGFVAGSVDLLLASLDHVLKMQSQGLDAIAISGMTEYHAYALIAKEGRFVSGGIAALRGRKIGITTPGSATDLSIRYELKKAGLDTKDVTLISIGGASAMRAALENNQIDAGMVLGATLVDMLYGGGWGTVIDFRARPHPLEVVVARQAWLKANPETARRFLRALARGAHLLQTDAEAAYEVTKFMFPKMDQRVLRAVSDAGVRRLSPDGSINPAGVSAIMEQQIFAGVIREPIPYARLIDLSYLPKSAGR